jgi:hypothetical protein
LDGLQKHIRSIDIELDAIASQHLTKIGPRSESPADLAKRIVAERDAYRWFTDRPLRFVSETDLNDREIAALLDAHSRCGQLIDHMNAKLPSPSDLPDVHEIVRCHEDLVAAEQHEKAAASGPARSLRISTENVTRAQVLAQTLDDLARTFHAITKAPWIKPFRLAAIRGGQDPWTDRLRECIHEWTSIDVERAALLRRSVVLPKELIDSADAYDAIIRAASGQRLWPLITLGKGSAKSLVGSIRLDGAPVKEDDQNGWRYVAAVLANVTRQRDPRRSRV